MSNTPFDPERHSSYGPGPYQPPNPYASPAQQVPDPYLPPTQVSSNAYPPAYQSTNPYAPPPPTYPPANPYAPPPPSYPPADPYAPPPGKPQRNTIFLIAGIIVIVVIMSISGLYAFQHNASVASSTPTFTPPTSTPPTATPGPTPLPYPAIANAYSGTVHNTTYNNNANMAMTSITQNTDALSGRIKFGLPLVGSGAFTGSVTTNKTIQFVVSSSDMGGVGLTFSGSIAPDGSMSGSYTVDNGQKGTWKASQSANPVVYPILYHNYSGNALNTKSNKSVAITIQIVTQDQQNFTGLFVNAIAITGGTVGSDNSIQFTVADSQGVQDKFIGTVNIDGSLSGTYSSGGGGAGTWKVTPA